MYIDVQELSDFYHTPLGTVARRLIGYRIRTLWPDVRKEKLLGIGFAAPFMRPFLAEAGRVILAMPEQQGAIRWPHDGLSSTFLASETQLPLADASVDKVLAVHCLEGCAAANALLREIWRVLAPEGRLLLIAPNRRGLWARFDTTPFGHGRPYSRGQLARLLADCLYDTAGWSSGLFMPPLNWRIVLKTAVAVERAGQFAWPGFSGVLMVEAQKQLYAPIGRAVPAKAKLRTANVASPPMNQKARHEGE
jgi:SAM-dependent methyltransferase